MSFPLKSHLWNQGAAFLVLLSLSACRDSDGNTPPAQSVPTVLSTTPLNGATNVALGATFSATFSQAMDPTTLNTTTVKATSGPLAIPLQGTVTYANSTAVFAPTAPLMGSSAITVTITTGAKSAAGVAMAVDRAWTFTCGGRATTPTILSTTPLSGATGVGLNGNISATFSEAMNPTTLTTSTFTVTSGAAATPVLGTVTYANSTAVFVPAAPFASAGSYTAKIKTGAKSAYGVALTTNKVWSFTTGGGAPTTPTVLSITPLDGALNVPLNGSFSATFSEAMDPTTLNTNTFKVTSGVPALPVAGTVTYANATTLFVPSASLPSSTLFTATVTTGAKSAGNVALSTDRVWSFTTGSGIITTPTVLSTNPLNGATGVPLNGNVKATFSEAMDPATLTPDTFTVTSGVAATPVLGTVIYANAIATFLPAAHLASNTALTATITTGAKSATGVALAANQAWTFTTGSGMAMGLPVNLGTAANFIILAKSGISTVPASAITGHIGVSPAAATYITGFSLTADATNVFSTSPQVTGKIYAADYASPTPSNLTTAVGDMELAFTEAAGRAADVTELGAGNIGGLTIAPGVYKWGTGVLIPSNITLSGSATDVWIFQVAQDLIMSNGTSIFLIGGALPKNVFWQVSGMVDIGTTAHCEGIVLCQTGITLKTGASANGRLLAQTAVNIDSSTLVQPAP